MNNNPFRPIKANQKIRGTRRKPGVLTVSIPEGNGAKIVFSYDLCRKLSIFDEVFLLTDGTNILISGQELYPGCPSYQVRTYTSNRRVIYSWELALELAHILKLDFSNCVSRTIMQAEFFDDDDRDFMYAFVSDELENLYSSSY